MKIAQSESGWVLAVNTADEKEPTIFKLTVLANDKFVCINEENDFPKKIEYWKQDDKLNAIISGGGPRILFEFERVK